MNDNRKTINRRTFIKTAGGILITSSLAGKLTKAHSMALPSFLQFKITLGRWRNNEAFPDQAWSGYLDPISSGALRIFINGSLYSEHFINANSNIEFQLPTHAASEWTLIADDLAHRHFKARFENGLLYLTNSDRNGRTAIYHWSPDDNCYTMDYWQDSLYITGPSDPGCYLAGFTYRPLSQELSETQSTLVPLADTTTGLEAYWNFQNYERTFEEPIYDNSGKNRFLTSRIPQSPRSAAGYLTGNAPYFNGSSDGLRWEGGAPTGEEFTVTCWAFRRDLAHGEGTIMEVPLDDENAVWRVTHSLRNFDLVKGITGICEEYSTSPWTFLAVVYKDGQVTFWVNGTKRTAAVSSLASPDEDDLTLGYSRVRSYPLEGMVDEVTVYSRALTDADIAVLRNIGKSTLGEEDAVGIPDNSSFSPGTDPGAPIGSMNITNTAWCGDGTEKSCCGDTVQDCGTGRLQTGLAGPVAQAGMLPIAPRLRMALLPTRAALENAETSGQTGCLTFGGIVRWTYPDGTFIEGFCALDQQTQLPDSDFTVLLGWERSSPICNVYADIYIPNDLVARQMHGLHRITTWSLADDGSRGNKRWHYVEFR